MPRKTRNDQDDPLNQAVAAELRREKGESGMTYAQIGQAAGLSPSVVRRYFEGERVLPLVAVNELTAALGVDFLGLMSRAHQRAQESDG